MTTSLRALSTAALGGLLLVTALTGCATAVGSSPAPESTTGPATAEPSFEPQAAWLDATSFVLKVWGDACAPQIGDVIAGEQSLEIVLTDAGDEVCAAVQTAHGLFFGLPAAFDSSRPVELTVTDAGGEKAELTLPGLAGGEIIPADRMSEQMPAVAWIGEGELAVLTWGSSTCMPGSGTFEAVGASTGIVRLQSHADSICTMDLVPQITFVPTEGVSKDVAVTLEGYVDADGAPVVVTAVV